MKAWGGGWGSGGKSGGIKICVWWIRAGHRYPQHNLTRVSFTICKTVCGFVKVSGAYLKNIKQSGHPFQPSLHTHHSLDARVNNCPYHIKKKITKFKVSNSTAPPPNPRQSLLILGSRVLCQHFYEIKQEKNTQGIDPWHTNPLTSTWHSHRGPAPPWQLEHLTNARL